MSSPSTSDSRGAPPATADSKPSPPAEAGKSDVTVAAEMAGMKEVSFKAIMLGSGPRFARDAFGPLLAFYVGFKLFNTVVGVVLSTIVALVAYRYEKKRDRPGNIARLSLAFIVLEAIIGLITRSAEIYLAQPIILSSIFGLVFFVSAFTRRPLAGVFAQEIYPFPPEVKASITFLRIFRRLSLVWGVYQLVRSAIRGAVLLSSSIDVFLIINVITGFPLIAALMSWSIWYGLTGFRKSKEWGWALTGGEAPPEVLAAYLANQEAAKAATAL